MIASVDAFRAGRIELRRLVVDLKGLLGVADRHDDCVVAEWWNHAALIDMELDTEDWAPEGWASVEAPDRAVSDFGMWACSVLDATDLERT